MDVTETKRQLALRRIKQMGDPILRSSCSPVREFDKALSTQIDNMDFLMQNATGIGLAAPQIGILNRVLVYRMAQEDESQRMVYGELQEMVNPRLVSKSSEEEEDMEGCLSIQGIEVPVRRSVAIEVEFQDRTGQKHTQEFEGFEARVIQHEMDHLDGIMMLSRTDPEARRQAMAIIRMLEQPLEV